MHAGKTKLDSLIHSLLSLQSDAIWDQGCGGESMTKDIDRRNTRQPTSAAKGAEGGLAVRVDLFQRIQMSVRVACDAPEVSNRF